MRNINNNIIRIALLHIAPRTGEIQYNRAQIRYALALAAGYGADLAITPELAESGYSFASVIDLNTVPIFPNDFLYTLREVAFKYNMNLIVGFPEHDNSSLELYNTLAYIDRTGKIQDTYRKIHVSEDEYRTWETPGDRVVVENIDGLQVGFLIGEDVFYRDIAYQCKRMGAQLLLAQMAWPKVEWNASKEWETCAKEIGLPLIVCNRTGCEGVISFAQGESVVINRGKIEYLFAAWEPGVFIIEFNSYTNCFSFVGSMKL
ncbi:carbon-nitrogen hydrolase family protein [Cellulosilyticum sp. I15G10I2]|uniref:carbon-nitrogen hydrolase family protein n=1 Tax=Cellulosilyticum sp. I15G10I2 TaxID=1892843 RepID=UPI00085C1B66|nr:carbon-nitrogen hydrolase family protein [Cellulosilyticum sp. I15G10I2]